MMWKRPVSKFKNVEADDHNRHPSLRLSHNADKLTALSVSEDWLVWVLNDGSVLVAPNLPDLSGAPKRLPGAPSALNAVLSPFRSSAGRLAILSANSLFVCGPHLLEESGARTLPLPFTVRRQGALAWNSSAEAVLAICSGETTVAVADAAEPRLVWSSDLSAGTNDVSWDPFGAVLAVSLNNGLVMRCDPRAPATDEILDSKFAKGADSRIAWTSDANYVLVSGSDSMREREVRLYDVRAPTSSVGRMPCGRGLSPSELLYDSDTGMLHCFARMDPTLHFAEVLAEGAEPLVFRSKAMLASPIVAAASAPRWANDLMQCEVVRIFVAAGDRLSQLRCRVPRKSYTEFCPDYFELAFLGDTAVSNVEWATGASLLSKRAHLTPSLQAKMLNPETVKDADPVPAPVPTLCAAPRAATPPPVTERASTTRRVLNIERGSAFKHLAGHLSQKCEHVPTARQLETRVPTECDLVSANARFVAFQVVGAAALELHDRRDLQSVTVLESGSPLQHFAFDQLHPNRIAVGCTDGRVRVWNDPKDKGDGVLRDPELILGGHNAKISLVLFHRGVENLLLTAAFDGEIFLWDLEHTDEPLGVLTAPGALLALCWSPDGNQLAALDDTGCVRLWPEPRTDAQRVLVSPAAVTSPRGGRLVWCQSGVLFASGFRGNKRLLTTLNLEATALTIGDQLEIETTSPAVLALIPDIDKGLVLAVGRGDHTVRAFDVSNGSICEVSSYSSDVQLQSLALFSPYECDVTHQEVAKGMLLTQSTLQPITFVVPRVKTEFFHDDLFPACSTPPGPVANAAQWWAGHAGGVTSAVSLRPAGMPLYSEWRREEDERQKSLQNKFTARTEAARTELTEKQRQEQLVASMKNILDSNALPIFTTDDAEGVDSDEWDD